jgi:hypothetical protein
MDSKIRGKQVAIDAVLGSREEENSIRQWTRSRSILIAKEYSTGQPLKD